LVDNGANIHTDNDRALLWSSENGHCKIIEFLISSDLEYFSKNKITRIVVIDYKLFEFYEKYNIK
jgi:hypothetical protein